MDDEMEMEIDDTVPNPNIIEHNSSSESLNSSKLDTEATSEPTEGAVSAFNVEHSNGAAKALKLSELHDPESPRALKPRETSDNNGEHLESCEKENLTSSTKKLDDDLEIIEVSERDKGTPTKDDKLNKRKSLATDDEVVVLDDDDDDDESLNTSNDGSRKRKKRKLVDIEVKECDIIDLVPTKKNTENAKCINYACSSGKDMIIAPVFCLSFYRVKSSDNKMREVCKECYDAALVHYDQLAAALERGESLVDKEIPLRNDLVEIDDSDSENEDEKQDTEYLDEESIAFLQENFDIVLKEAMMKYKVDDQIKSAQKHFEEKRQTVKDKFAEVDGMLRNIQKQLDVIHHNLYGEFKTKYEYLPTIDIMDVYLPHAKPVVRTIIEPKKDYERRSPRSLPRKISYAELDDPASSNSPVVYDGKKGGDIAETEEVEVPADLPPKEPLVKPTPKVGEMYYSARVPNTGHGTWMKVQLMNVLKPGSMVNGQAITQTMYFVENKVKGFQNRMVSGKEMAFADPCHVQLDVGTRVIAEFKQVASVGESKKQKRDCFSPGIVAEPLSAYNKYRYLIFFDDGYAQYVHYNMVLVIFEANKDVWEDVLVDSRPFIKKYLESYPERPMVKLLKDQTVRTEYNGKWWATTVMQIDCSLVQMFFDATSRLEWIYRGSTRLNPMFKEEQAASNRLQNKARTPRKINSTTGETAPYVQYTRNEPDSASPSEQGKTEQLQAPVRSVAKKSTAKPLAPVIRPAVTSLQTCTVPFLPVGNNKQQIQALQPPPPSKVVYFTPRSQANTKTVFKPHACSQKCKQYIIYNVNKLNGYNPLSKPLLCGWNRVTYKHKGKREINYKAPCGRFVRSMSELHNYLQLTQSDMTVDLFDFDFWVHCLAEFVLERNSTIIKDLSYGLEQVPIPVVNYNDNEMNDFCNYSIKREPMEGVHLNLDPEFLCGCDCEDDCQDKTKCACWQLTFEGLPYLNKNMSTDYVGYTYRRLPEAVITGIYECNSRCKCGPTCLNRVVQHPLQLKLQVFKTNNRGWGIRCLNDIPQGSFICIYAGSLLTEQMANEGGKNYGDEYLAELDYIEVVEKVKEDYEEEPYEEEDEDYKDSRSQDGSAEEDYDDRQDDEPIGEDDQDFIPSFVPRDGAPNSTIRTRLRRRNLNQNKEENVKKGVETRKRNKNEEEDTVTISDDEDSVREPSSFNPKTQDDLDENKKHTYKSVRELFGEDESVYIMDAKVTGNIGRFLNHSCSPNVFVQNVFVDTHDPRFPWVAFFALTYIRAGTELTWNYNYDVGSVPGKVLYCHCSSMDCRGRLL